MSSTWHPSTFQKVAFPFPNYLGNGEAAQIFSAAWLTHFLQSWYSRQQLSGLSACLLFRSATEVNTCLIRRHICMQSVCCFSSHALINKTLSIRLILWDFGIITGEEKKINNHVYGLQDTFSIGTVSKQIKWDEISNDWRVDDQERSCLCCKIYRGMLAELKLNPLQLQLKLKYHLTRFTETLEEVSPLFSYMCFLTTNMV